MSKWLKIKRKFFGWLLKGEMGDVVQGPARSRAQVLLWGLFLSSVLASFCCLCTFGRWRAEPAAKEYSLCCCLAEESVFPFQPYCANLTRLPWALSNLCAYYCEFWVWVTHVPWDSVSHLDHTDWKQEGGGGDRWAPWMARLQSECWAAKTAYETHNRIFRTCVMLVF